MGSHNATMTCEGGQGGGNPGVMGEESLQEEVGDGISKG